MLRGRLLFAAFLLLLPLGAGPALAERLPFRHYTTQDGLARDLVMCIVEDSRGFLWFGTVEGLSRFDGYGFTNFDRDDGMQGQAVAAVVETRDGAIWVGTEEGLARLEPAAGLRQTEAGPRPFPLFRTFVPDGASTLSIRSVLESRDGSLWVGAFTGLYRFDPRAGRFESIDLGVPGARDARLQVNAVVEQPDGVIWIATRYLGLIRRSPDGRTQRFFVPADPPHGNIRALVADGKGGLWAGGWDGLMHIAVGADGIPAVDGRYGAAEGLPDQQVYALMLAADGQLVVGSGLGITFVSSRAGAPATMVARGVKQGLSVLRTTALAEDRSGNLWIGSDSAGVFKLARDGFTTYTGDDYHQDPAPAAFARDRRGRLYSCTRTTRSEWTLTSLDEPSFRTYRFNLPPQVVRLGWGISQLALQDREGDWWVPTSNGLIRYPATDAPADLAGLKPRAVYTTADGLPGDDILMLFEDSRSDIWVAGGGMARFERASGRFVKSDIWANAFAEDTKGQVWVGSTDGTVRRYRDGGIDSFSHEDGVPLGAIESIFTDSRGRIWIGTTDGGAARVDDPSAPKPVFVHWSVDKGLSSREVNCFTEDRWGRIYMGTGRGVDVIEPGVDRIRHFSVTDGLAGSHVLIAARAESGALWFGMSEGLSRLVPRPPGPRRPPSIFISQVSVAGVDRPVNLLGERALAGLTLPPDQHQIAIGFVGLDFSAGERLRYQYRLEGADQDWSAPTDSRAVNYAHLSPGRYRFAVKALDSEGQDSPAPATVSFVLLRPVWQRWWFLTLVASALAALGYALFRYRVARLLELERIRTHIATDLHDDIGASLSQIAILNEVALTRLKSAGGDATGLLSTAAQSARELVDAMSDVVWAVDPKRDHLEDLVLRMRRFAEDLCAARGIDLRFTAPAEGGRRLEARLRRQIHLVFKESLNNAVKHSGCRSIAVDLSLDTGGLRLRVADDGRGFDPPAGTEGRGLASMRRRAEALGGRMRLTSAAGSGTELIFTVPA